MTKQLIKLLISLCLCATLALCAIGFTACAVSIEKGNGSDDNSQQQASNTTESIYIFTLLDNDTYSIKANISAEMPNSLILPSTHGDKNVTEIASGAFRGYDNIISVMIPDTVKVVGDEAFRNCSSLTTVTIPESVTSIEDRAFMECSALVNANISVGVTSIGESAFSDCSSLTSITIPEGVIDIGMYAFHYCTSLTSISIPDSVTSLGNYAFYGCEKLALTYDNWGGAYIGNSKNSYLILVKAATQNITACTVNAKTKFIFSWAFYDCSKLTSITMSDNVIQISDCAFLDCAALTSIKLGKNVSRIDGLAFNNCTKLTSITFDGTTEQWNSMDRNTSWKQDSAITQVICKNGTINL